MKALGHPFLADVFMFMHFSCPGQSENGCVVGICV